MAAIESPYLLDVTRLIARGWSRRLSTGIDRVCDAYLHNFGARAQAVVQHRGRFRILSRRHSDSLFDLLQGADAGFRRRFLRFAPQAYATGTTLADCDGRIYINVSHTDFDLTSHMAWTRRCRLRPTYLIHDLIPITNAEFCRPHAVRRHHGRVVNALNAAAGIIVNSAATAADLTAFARRQRLPMPPMLAAPLAGAKLERRRDPNTLREPYFLAVGTIEPRKNHLLLLEVWRRLVAHKGAHAPRLVIIGQWGANSAPVRESLRANPELRAHVTVLNRCSDADLSQWMAGARALLMPTLAEGFGLPMAEALQLGAPVIASDLRCFREVGQGIPTLVPPDPDAWESAVSAFLGESPELRRQLAMMPKYRAATWDSHFRKVEDWFDALPAHPSRLPDPASRSLLRISREPAGAAAFAQSQL